MFNKVGTVCIFVADQDRAKDFYVNTLGFELRQDQPIYPGAANRWLAVAPKGAQTDIILYLPDQNWQHYAQVVGKSQAVTIDVSNVLELVKQLKAKGVKFQGEPDVQPWGTNVFMLDSEGNTILLVELPKQG
ncbi:MAG: VOC family protein [Anaerolineae bacterium]|nr:VOC family protein [Anaerolineae bacterium]